MGLLGGGASLTWTGKPAPPSPPGPRPEYGPGLPLSNTKRIQGRHKIVYRFLSIRRFYNDAKPIRVIRLGSRFNFFDGSRNRRVDWDGHRPRSGAFGDFLSPFYRIPYVDNALIGGTKVLVDRNHHLFWRWNGFDFFPSVAVFRSGGCIPPLNVFMAICTGSPLKGPGRSFSWDQSV